MECKISLKFFHFKMSLLKIKAEKKIEREKQKTEEAIADATIWWEEQLKCLAPLGRMPTLTQEQIDATYDPETAPHAGLPTACDLVKDGGWICGPPEHVYGRICEIQEQFPGLQRITVQGGALGIPPSAIRHDLEWFGREVLPKFRTK